MQTCYEPQWLRWARRLQALAQIGLTFADNHYEVERYNEIRAIAAEMMAVAADMPIQTILDFFATETGYTTPKVDVRGVVFHNDGILLVRELSDNGRWTLPGGWADVNDTPSQAVEREVREESGFETRAVKLLAIYDRSRHPHLPPYPYHIYKLFFRCELVGGSARPSSETGGAMFFRENEIPELSVSRVTPQQITRMFEHYRHPDWPTDFD